MTHSQYDHLDIGQWAWEFLRRNPEYRADYDEFIATWQALEAEYGAPPNRDFFRWKQDPRASRPAWDPSLSTGAACVTDDEDRQLIECWMGAKWGFYQFPQNPDSSALQLTTPINWRPPPAFDLRSGDDSPIRQKLNFDLSLPLPAQLEAARQWLVSEQIKLRRQGQAVPWNLDNQRDHWRELIDVLDKGDSTHSLRDKAVNMTRQGYREILHLLRNETSET
jgi:hypothetical protein